jgi:mRNA interferase RelE/StbE
VKTVIYTSDASRALRKLRSQAERITVKIERYAETGVGDVAPLTGRPGSRLRVGDFRVLFQEDATTITVEAVGPRGSVYD